MPCCDKFLTNSLFVHCAALTLAYSALCRVNIKSLVAVLNILQYNLWALYEKFFCNIFITQVIKNLKKNNCRTEGAHKKYGSSHKKVKRAHESTIIGTASREITHEHTGHITGNGQEYQRRRYCNSELRAHKRTSTLGEVMKVLLRSKRDVLPTTDMLHTVTICPIFRTETDVKRYHLHSKAWKTTIMINFLVTQICLLESWTHGLPK